MGCVSAQNDNDIDVNQTGEVLSVNADLNQDFEDGLCEDTLQSTSEEVVADDDSEPIVVEDWDDLQYYCSLEDKDYVVKLKENTNYYPTDVSDANYQINIKNNIRIIGSQGAYFGDVSPQAGKITYTAIKVDDDSGIGVTLENIEFKWIATRYQPDGVFFVMGGNAYNNIKNCYFTNITTDLGHSSILHLKRGYATLLNCTFINCTTDFGCVSIYDPKDDPTKTCIGASMEVTDCYFEGNYAKTEPGCINNCGILVVNNSTFYRNSAFWWAGAIHTHGGANTTIYYSDFLDNLAGWNGGALYTYSYLQIYSSRFIGNNCTTNNGGGAIGACKYLHAPYIHIEDTLFQNNENLCWGLDELSTSGTGRGGAISLMDEGGLEVYNSTFIKNSASIGTAICAISGGLSYGSPDVKLIGNKFINHTRVGDVLDVRLATGSLSEIRDNYFSNNSIVFTKLKLLADDPIDGKVTFHLDAALKNPKSYDEDILQKSKYDVYVNGVYSTTVSSTDFTLDLGKGNTANVYVVPSISNSKSNEVFAGIAKTFIYVSQSRGDDSNDGRSRDTPVRTLNRSIELARDTENIVIMDGIFSETNLTIDYNLTIASEKNVELTFTGNGFLITAGDVKFENLTFRNCGYGSNIKNRIISQNGTGFLILEGCVFDSNNYKTHIDTNGMLECEYLIVSNNRDSAFIKSDSIVLKSSKFINNTATSSTAKSLVMYKSTSKVTKFEAENLTFIGNTVHTACLLPAKIATATITGCTFIGNNGVSSGRASAICVENSGSVMIQSCLFIDNVDTGSYSSVIYASSGTIVIKDSILINNSNSNTAGLAINGNDAQLKKLTANNNWWGNTPDNLSKPALKVFPKSNALPNGWDPASYWLVLNASVLSNDVELNDRIPVQFIFTQIDNEGNVTTFDGGFMPSIELTLNAVNGTCSDEKITMVNGMATTYFTLTDMSGGSLTASFNGIDSTVHFQFKKSTPNMTVDVNDISVGDDLNVEVTLDSGVTGQVIIKIGNINQTKSISTSQTFTVSGLHSGNHTIEVNYTGNEMYESVVKTVEFCVNKLPSQISISYGPVVLNEDVVLTFNVTDSATGTIDVYVNGEKHTVNVGESYTIEGISRGDYNIRAVYNGDENYLASESEANFEVAKFEPAITVNIPDITYGNDTLIFISIDGSATGSVSANVDGKSNSTIIDNGQAIIAISNLNAGNNKNVEIFYSGDNNYKNATVSKTFNINKAKLDFTISSNDIKVGQDAVILITLPARIGGTVTLSGIKSEIKNVPASGIVRVTYADLANGAYTVSAQYDGDNYETTSKSTTFNVSLWDEPQWANEGGDVSHGGKSPYDSGANGEVKWIGQTGEITGNLAIDSEGNIYITAKNSIYSFDNDGNLRWVFSSSDAGGDFAGISISRDVIIAPKINDTLYFINQTTGERYGHSNLYHGSSYFAPMVDSNGNIYISGQGDANNPNLVIIPYKLWENGGNPTLIPLGASPIGVPILINENLVAVPCYNGLKIVDLSSKEVVASLAGNTDKGFVAVGDGDILYAILGNSISAISPVGYVIWGSEVTGGIGNSLVIDRQQSVYSVNSKGELYRYDLIDGSESKFTNLTVTSGILVGNDNNVYFASNNVFYALDANGNILWKSKLGGEIVGTPIMDINGVIYVNGLNNVYALKQAELMDVNLSISAADINIGETQTITITLNENATGMIEIDINGNVTNELIADGKIIKSIFGLIAGNYTVKVTYPGDLRYSGTLKSKEFNVLRFNPEVVVLVNNITYGQDAVFDITLPDDAEGIVSVNVDGKSNSSNLIGGSTKIVISGLSTGIKKATIEYYGSSIYSPVNVSCDVHVNKSTIVNNDTFPVSNDPTVYSINMPADAEGVLTVTVDGKNYTEQLVNGKATVVIPKLDDGSYNIVVSYSGDDKYAPISRTLTVNVTNILDSHFDISNGVQFNVYAVDYAAGERGKVLRFKLLDSNGNSLAGKAVKLNDGASSINLITDANGFVYYTVNAQKSGVYSCSISFSGDSKLNPAEVSFTVKVNKKPITIKAKSKTFKAKTKTKKYSIILKTKKCSSNNGKIYLKAGKKVTLKIKGKTYAAKINKKGKAVFKIKKLTKKGTYKAIIKFKGDKTYKAVTKKVKIKIK